MNHPTFKIHEKFITEYNFQKVTSSNSIDVISHRLSRQTRLLKTRRCFMRKRCHLRQDETTEVDVCDNLPQGLYRNCERQIREAEMNWIKLDVPVWEGYPFLLALTWSPPSQRNFSDLHRWQRADLVGLRMTYGILKTRNTKKQKSFVDQRIRATVIMNVTRRKRQTSGSVDNTYLVQSNNIFIWFKILLQAASKSIQLLNWRQVLPAVFQFMPSTSIMNVCFEVASL